MTINTIASDDILNVSEAGAGITISGTTTAQAGQTLTVTLNNNTYQTTVRADGAPECERSGDGFKRINRQQLYRDRHGERQSGNPASADHALAVDVTAPDLTINTVAGDDIINAIEHGQALVVSGTSTGAAAGDVVTVNLNGKTTPPRWTPPVTGAWVFRRRMSRHWQPVARPSPPAWERSRGATATTTTHDVTVDLSGPTLTISHRLRR